MKYRIVSSVYKGGGVLSSHRTLGGAERAIRKEDAAIRHLNRFGGTYYHDCWIEECVEGEWRPLSPEKV
jgi:hypothetical protein